MATRPIRYPPPEECPICKHEVSPRAAFCPHCGERHYFWRLGVDVGVVSGMKIGFGVILSLLMVGAGAVALAFFLAVVLMVAS